MQSCRRQGSAWAIGTSIAACSDEAARPIVEYCYVVSQRERLRGSTPVALPAPLPLELVAPVSASRAPDRRLSACAALRAAPPLLQPQRPDA